MSKLKILMLNYEFPPIGGGAANAHLALLKEYAQNNGLKIDVLTSAPKPGFFEEKFSNNITIFKVGVHKRNLHYWRKMEVIEWLIKASRHYQKLLNQNHYDLVHAFFAFPSAYLCYKTADKLPFIISLRGSDVPGFNIRLGLDYKLLSGLFKKIWYKASAIVANSNGLCKLALNFTPDLNINVIPNGVDTERFYPSTKQKSAQLINFLTVCRLISRKRIDMLIEALAKLKQNDLNIQLNIVGDGNLMDTLKQLTEKLNVSDCANFMGRIPPEQMPQLYRNNDIFIMSSEHEGMSNAMLEAMASGLPIITTKCEGMEELINNNGIIVEQQTSESLAKAMKYLAQSPEKYNTMHAASKKQVEKFSWKKTAEDYFKLYEQTIRNTSQEKGVCVK